MSTSERNRLAALACLALLGAAGCVESALMDKYRPSRYDSPPMPSAPPPSADGSIFRGDTAAGSFLFFDRKARGVGDLVTVIVAENASAVGRANTSLDKESSLGASITSDIGLTDALQGVATSILEALGTTLTTQTIPSGQSVNAFESATSSGFEGDGETGRSGSFTGVVTCRVVDILPGGVFHIHGRREIVVNHELQLITVEGLVRREDISIHNTVPSSVLADARLTYDGLGVLDDKQRPSLFARLIDWVYPF